MRTDEQWLRFADGLFVAAAQEQWDRFGDLVCDALADGHTARLSEVLRPSNNAAIPLAIRILRSDLAVRDQTVDFHSLLELDRKVRSSSLPPECGRWMGAILAEWGLWRGDFSTFGYAHAAEDTRSGTARTTRLIDFSEARRRRILALMLAVMDPRGSETAAAAAEVQELFTRAGAPEELAVTAVILGYAELSIADSLSGRAVDRIRTGIDELEVMQSDRVGVGLAFLAWGAYMVGDFATCGGALDRLHSEILTTPTLPPVVVEGVSILRAVVQMTVAGPVESVMNDLHRHFEQLRRTNVPSWMLGPVANDLLDAGQVEFAVDVMAAVGPADPFILAADQIIREVNARIRIQRDGDHSAIKDLWNLYGEFEFGGRVRRAAQSAIRCARTCRIAGFDDDAARFAQWGVYHLPAEPDRTPWERIYLAGGDASAHWGAASRGTLRVLVPHVIVTGGGREESLDGRAGQLVAILAAARRPVPTADLLRALWPEADHRTANEQLEATLFEIRVRLRLLPDELLRYSGAGLAIDGHGWAIDAWQFWDLTAGGDAPRLRAIELYETDLVSSSPADGDLLDEGRSVLRERWLEALQSLVQEGRLSDAQAGIHASRVAPGEVLVLR